MPFKVFIVSTGLLLISALANAQPRRPHHRVRHHPHHVVHHPHHVVHHPRPPHR